MVMNVIGSIFINLGTNLWKLAHKWADAVQAARGDHKRPSNRHSKIYLIGVGMFLIGNLLNFASMSMAAQTLLSGLGSIQFVTNIVFGRYVLREIVTWRMVFATGLIVAGNFVMVIFADHSSPSRSVDDLVALYRVSLYLFYLMIQIALCVAVFFFNRWARRVCPARQNVHAASYSLVSGIIGAQSVVFGKQESELLKNWITGEFEPGQIPFMIGITVAWAATMAFWLMRMNRALRVFDGTIIVPLLQICWTFFATQGSAVYFREYSQFSMQQIAVYHLGLLVTLSGVFVLTTGSSRQTVRDDQEEELSLAPVDRSRFYISDARGRGAGKPDDSELQNEELHRLARLSNDSTEYPGSEEASHDGRPPGVFESQESVVLLSTDALVESDITKIEVDKTLGQSLQILKKTAGSPYSSVRAANPKHPLHERDRDRDRGKISDQATGRNSPSTAHDLDHDHDSHDLPPHRDSGSDSSFSQVPLIASTSPRVGGAKPSTSSTLEPSRGMSLVTSVSPRVGNEPAPNSPHAMPLLSSTSPRVGSARTQPAADQRAATAADTTISPARGVGLKTMDANLVFGEGVSNRRESSASPVPQPRPSVVSIDLSGAPRRSPLSRGDSQQNASVGLDGQSPDAQLSFPRSSPSVVRPPLPSSPRQTQVVDLLDLEPAVVPAAPVEQAAKSPSTLSTSVPPSGHYRKGSSCPRRRSSQTQTPTQTGATRTPRTPAR